MNKIFVILLLTLPLIGCGRMGSLYLPSQHSTNHKPTHKINH
ncbi:MAG: lipoprotein [Gammaproteobacteria bacterium]|nr:lipoprotein [Gammaproteobacteria bacterium]